MGKSLSTTCYRLKKSQPIGDIFLLKERKIAIYVSSDYTLICSLEGSTSSDEVLIGRKGGPSSIFFGEKGGQTDGSFCVKGWAPLIISMYGRVVTTNRDLLILGWEGRLDHKVLYSTHALLKGRKRWWQLITLKAYISNLLLCTFGGLSNSDVPNLKENNLIFYSMVNYFPHPLLVLLGKALKLK